MTMVAAATFSIAGVLAAILWVVSRIPVVLSALQEPDSTLAARVAELEVKLRGMQHEIDQLPSIWKDEADRAVKAEKRAAHHRRRAEALTDGGDVDDDPGGDVQGQHGAGGGPQGVLPMHEALGGAPDPQARLSEIRRRVALGV